MNDDTFSMLRPELQQRIRADHAAGRNLMNRIYSAVNVLYSENRNPRYVLVGHIEYVQLKSLPEMRFGGPFDEEYVQGIRLLRVTAESFFDVVS